MPGTGVDRKGVTTLGWTTIGARAGILPALAMVALAGAACGGSAGTAAPTATPAVERSPAAPGGSTGGGGTTGAIDCSLLSPADISAAGIQGAGAPSDNPDDTSHYCVYAGTSGATGGIEFDVFPNASVADAQATYATAAGEGGGGAGQPAAGATFDQSSYSVQDKAAFLAVRQGRLVFALSAPDGPATQAALVALAYLVVQRAGSAATP